MTYPTSADKLTALAFFFASYKRKMNKQEEQRVLDIAATAGRTPRRVASGRTILVTGQGSRKYVVLANGDELTRAGEYWYEKTRQVKPNRHFDPNQETSRKGDGDYIQTSSGLRRVRQLGPDGEMQLTALGKKFYQNRHTEYVVEVPVLIEVTDSKGKRRVRTGEHLPVNELGLGNIFANDGLTEAQKIARVKNEVLRQLDGPTRSGRTVLMEFSGQVFSYDRNGTWLISAMATYIPSVTRRRITGKQGAPQAPGPRTEVALHRDLSQGDPLGAISSTSFLPHDPEAYLEEAFEQHPDRLCVPRQLAALTRRSMEEVCASFDGLLEEGWREQGVRPQEIERWCALYGHPYFLVRAGKLVKIQDVPEKLGRAIAYCVFDGHAYFYKSAKTVASWTVGQGPSGAKQVMQHEHRQTLPEISEWKSWSMPPQPGHFFAHDLAGERSESQGLAVQGRSDHLRLLHVHPGPGRLQGELRDSEADRAQRGDRAVAAEAPERSDLEC